MEIHNLHKSVREHFGDFLAKIRAVWKTAPAPVTDDGARSDGGKTTEHQPVSDQKMKDLGDSAVDHTREEPGS